MLEVQDQSVSKCGFSWSLSPWLPNGYFLLAICLCTCSPDVSRYVLISSFYMDTNQIGLGSFYYSFKSPFSKYRHILSYWELRLQHINLRRDTISLWQALIILQHKMYSLFKQFLYFSPQNNSDIVIFSCFVPWRIQSTYFNAWDVMGTQ